VRFLFLTHTIIFLLFSSISLANNKIVYVDMDKILATTISGSSILKQLEELNVKNIESFKKKEAFLKNEEKDLINQKNILSNVEYKDRVSKLKSKIADYNTSKKEIILNFNKIRQENTNKLLNLINKILTTYSEEKKISLILQKKNLILGKTELDITDKIIITVNRDVKEFKIK
jgi:outer membrane protein|tara:strand:+ start:31 stop:552 length:522 start_codon:yes stop_codon:yes gene_type:complete